jgi:hypothetical protein
MRPVGAHKGGDLDPIDHAIRAGGGLGLGSYRINAGIGAASARQLLDALINILVLEIDHGGTSFAGHCHALGHGINGDHALGAEQKGASNGKLADRAAAPDGDRIALLDVAEIGRHVTGRENIGQEQRLIVGHAVGNFNRTDISVGHTQILGLAAGKPTKIVGIAEQTCGRMAPELLNILGVGVRALAT